MSQHPVEKNPAYLIHILGPALQAKQTTPRERAELLYDVATLIYDHVKFYVQDSPDERSPELERIGTIRNAALPPSDEVLQAELEDGDVQ